MIPALSAAPALVRRQGPAIRGASVRAHGVIARPPEDGSSAEVFLGGGCRAQFAAAAAHAISCRWQRLVAGGDRAAPGAAPVTLAELRQFRREGAHRRRHVAGWFRIGDHRRDCSRGTMPRRPGGEIRLHARHRAFDQAAPPERLRFARGGDRAIEQLGVLRRVRDAQDLPRLRSRPAPGDRDVAISRRARRISPIRPRCSATIELVLDGEAERQRRRSACCSALCAIRATAGRQALNYLTRYLDDALISRAERPVRAAGSRPVFFLTWRASSASAPPRCTARWPSDGGDDPDFAPEPIAREDIADWRDRTRGRGRARC